MLERSDFEALLERKAKEQEERLAQRTQATYARQMRVEESQLTQDPKWDKFLTHIQPLVDDAEKAVADTKAGLLNPKTSNEGVMYMRMIGSYAQGRADALKEVMGLPKLLAAEAHENQSDALVTNNGRL